MGTCLNCIKDIGDRPRNVFCSHRCCALYNNGRRPPATQATRASISAGLKRHFAKNGNPQKGSAQHALAVGRSTAGKFGRQAADNIYECSSRTKEKILLRLGLSCFNCGWDAGVCDIHHIRGRGGPDPHNHKNLTYLCPNCHRLVHSGKIDGTKMTTLADVIGDRWREYYYG